MSSSSSSGSCDKSSASSSSSSARKRKRSKIKDKKKKKTKSDKRKKDKKSKAKVRKKDKNKLKNDETQKAATSFQEEGRGLTYAEEVAAINAKMKAAGDSEREAKKQKKKDEKRAAKAAIASELERLRALTQSRKTSQEVDANAYDPTKKRDVDYSKPTLEDIANSGLHWQTMIGMNDRSHYTADQLQMHDARNAKLGN